MVVSCLPCLLAHLTCKSACSHESYTSPLWSVVLTFWWHPLKPVYSNQMFILPSLLWHTRLELVPPYASGLPAPYLNQWERIWWIGYMSVVPLELISWTSAIPFRSANCFQYPCANIETTGRIRNGAGSQDYAGMHLARWLPFFKNLLHSVHTSWASPVPRL